jgi:hypothetical protein
LKCERCGEREAEVVFANVVRTAEGEEAQSQQLCRGCAKVDPAAMEARLEGLLGSEQELTPEQRSALQGVSDLLKELRPDAGSSG